MDDFRTQNKELFDDLERLEKFASIYPSIPYKQANSLLDRLKEFNASLFYSSDSKTLDELHRSELKRRLNGTIFGLEDKLFPKPTTYENIIGLYSIPQEDLDGLKTWLITHKDEALASIERLYETVEIVNNYFPVGMDMVFMKEKTEKFAAEKIDKYHLSLGEHLKELTNVGVLFDEIKVAASHIDRSYYNPGLNTLALSISALCSMDNQYNIHLNKSELIRLYGHEGMGHAFNYALTKKADMAFFLKKYGRDVESTMESVAQFYENIVFEDLKNSPETQEKLGISEEFNKLYLRKKDADLLNEYAKKEHMYGITVLADKSLGNPLDRAAIDRRIDLLKEVVLDPNSAINMIYNHRYHYDPDNNFNFQMVSELRYCAQPVKRILEAFEKAGKTYGEDRGLIDKTILTGFWTPMGIEQHAKLVIEGKSTL